MSTRFDRQCDRICRETNIMHADCETREYRFGKLYNFSRDGMYFESDRPFNPGTDLFVRMGTYYPSLSGPVGYDHYRVNVKWCRKILGSTSYGVGVSISGTVTE